MMIGIISHLNRTRTLLLQFNYKMIK